MNSILSLFHPFKSMGDVCIALQIIYKYESLQLATKIISGYFKIPLKYEDIEILYGRVNCFPNIFPLEYIKNVDENINISKKRHIFWLTSFYIFLNSPEQL